MRRNRQKSESNSRRPCAAACCFCVRLPAGNIVKFADSCYTYPIDEKKGEINGIQHGRSALPAGGQRKKRTAPQYGPVGTGCPFVEEAVARLYREQNEEHFWSLMNALNYALELQTKVLVPLDAAVDPQSGAAPWAHLPIPEERAEGLPPWLLHARKERHYLPLFTSVKNAEAEKASATAPWWSAACAAPWSMRWKRTASTVWCWTRGQALPRWMSPCSAGC